VIMKPLPKAAFLLVMASAAWAADPVLVVDRGLPASNLNNVSGTSRSNVRWGSDDEAFVGDNFTVGSAGEKWVIDGIRTWAVPGQGRQDPDHLGDFFQDVRLYLGAKGSDVTPVASALLSAGSDETSNPDVQVSEATRSGAQLYDDFGAALRVWQVDFKGLAVPVAGGTSYSFGVWGQGRAVPGKNDKAFEWFNHAANAPLSGVRQDGSDGLLLLFDGAGKGQGTFNGLGHGWDKGSDINIQVFAHRVQ
jgi:hypothetical protein